MAKFRFDLVRGHELESKYHSSSGSTWIEPRELALEALRGLDNPPQQISFGLRNASAAYQTALPKFQNPRKLPELEYYSDSDDNNYPNPQEEKPLSGPAQGVVIVSTLEGRFVYWPDKKPFALAEDDDTRLVACLGTLPYQEGAPLSTILEEEEGDTVILEDASSSSASHSPSRELFTTLTPHNGGDGSQNSREPVFPADVSVDELFADAPQAETEEQKTARRLRNTKCGELRQCLIAALPVCNLQETLDAVEMRPHSTPEACIASINVIGRSMPTDRAA